MDASDRKQRAGSQSGLDYRLGLAAMKRRHEEDVVTTLDLVALFAFELPICVIYEDKDARAT